MIFHTVRYNTTDISTQKQVVLWEEIGLSRRYPYEYKFGIVYCMTLIRSIHIVIVAVKLYSYIYVTYRLRGPDEKNCVRGLENGPSPKGEGRFQDRGHSFSHPDRRCR